MAAAATTGCVRYRPMFAGGDPRVFWRCRRACPGCVMPVLVSLSERRPQTCLLDDGPRAVGDWEMITYREYSRAYIAAMPPVQRPDDAEEFAVDGDCDCEDCEDCDCEDCDWTEPMGDGDSE